MADAEALDPFRADLLELLGFQGEADDAPLVDGVLAGRPIVVLTPLAQVGIRVRGLVPGLTTRVMGLANRLLPGGTSSATVEGRDAARRLASPLVERLTTLGSRAARRFNERSAGRSSR